MKNSAIDRTSEIFSADQVSMCRSCRRARRGPRLFAGPRPRPRAGAPAASACRAAGAGRALGRAADAGARSPPAAVGIGGRAAPVAGGGGPAEPRRPAGPAVRRRRRRRWPAPCARCDAGVGDRLRRRDAGVRHPPGVSVGASASPTGPGAHRTRRPVAHASLPFPSGTAPRPSLAVTLGVGLVIVRRTGDRHDRHVLRQVHELDTHGRAVLVVPHPVDRRADHAAARR